MVARRHHLLSGGRCTVRRRNRADRPRWGVRPDPDARRGGGNPAGRTLAARPPERKRPRRQRRGIRDPIDRQSDGRRRSPTRDRFRSAHVALPLRLRSPFELGRSTPSPHQWPVRAVDVRLRPGRRARPRIPPSCSGGPPNEGYVRVVDLVRWRRRHLRAAAVRPGRGTSASPDNGPPVATAEPSAVPNRPGLAAAPSLDTAPS